MTIAVQTAFVTALAAAATAAGATDTYTDVAPSGAATSYVVWTPTGTTGPQRGLYGGGYDEGDVYMVSCVASSRQAAQTLADAIGAALHLARPAGTITIRRENQLPTPPRMPDQVRFVVQTYYRVRYIGGS